MSEIDLLDVAKIPIRNFSSGMKKRLMIGKLMLYEPRPGVQCIMPNRKEGKLPSHLWRDVSYEPTAGTIIMFPAWLWHEVQPNNSQDLRISVSFNFIQR